jgi:hypothetical protein
MRQMRHTPPGYCTACFGDNEEKAMFLASVARDVIDSPRPPEQRPQSDQIFYERATRRRLG